MASREPVRGEKSGCQTSLIRLLSPFLKNSFLQPSQAFPCRYFSSGHRPSRLVASLALPLSRYSPLRLSRRFLRVPYFSRPLSSTLPPPRGGLAEKCLSLGGAVHLWRQRGARKGGKKGESVRGPPFFDIKRVTWLRGEIESERSDGAPPRCGPGQEGRARTAAVTRRRGMKGTVGHVDFFIVTWLLLATR